MTGIFQENEKCVLKGPNHTHEICSWNFFPIFNFRIQTVSCHLDPWPIRTRLAELSCDECNHRMSQEMKLARLVVRAGPTGVAMRLLHPCRRDRQQSRSASHSNESTLVVPSRREPRNIVNINPRSTLAPMRFMPVSNEKSSINCVLVDKNVGGAQISNHVSRTGMTRE